MHFNGGGAVKGVILHHSLSHPGKKGKGATAAFWQMHKSFSLNMILKSEVRGGADGRTGCTVTVAFLQQKQNRGMADLGVKGGKTNRTFAKTSSFLSPWNKTMSVLIKMTHSRNYTTIVRMFLWWTKLTGCLTRSHRSTLNWKNIRCFSQKTLTKKPGNKAG